MTVTSENLDIEILKKFGAKIPAPKRTLYNLNVPRRKTFLQYDAENSEHKILQCSKDVIIIKFLKQSKIPPKNNFRVLHEVTLL